MRAAVRSLYFAVLCAASLARADTIAPGCDTSTEEAAVKAYVKATGQEPPEHCFARSERFPGVVTVGGFAHDRGCRWGGPIDVCAPKETNVARRAMAAAGWARGNDARRAELALDWLAEVEHYSLVRSQPDVWKRGGKKFIQPTTRRDGDGLLVRFWSQGPVGMRPILHYTLFEIRFDAQGQPGPAKTLDQVSIPMR